MPMTTDVYFRIFGIKKISDITPYELLRRYRKLALKFHPDRVNDDGENFKKIGIAYEYVCERMKEFIKKEDKKFYNPDFHYYGDGSIYSIKKKRWIRLKGKDGKWIKLNHKTKGV